MGESFSSSSMSQQEDRGLGTTFLSSLQGLKTELLFRAAELDLNPRSEDSLKAVNDGNYSKTVRGLFQHLPVEEDHSDTSRVSRLYVETRHRTN